MSVQQTPPGRARAAAVMSVAALFAAAVVGCGRDQLPTPVASLSYPVRSDWLVLSTSFPESPTAWNAPGVLPLQALDRELADPFGPKTSPLHKVLRQNLFSPRDPVRYSFEQRRQMAETLDKLFGTPAEPRVTLDKALGDEGAKIISELELEPSRLKRGSRLFAQHCAVCHGVAGDGRGWAGPGMIPPPRDYRSGQFKFVSSDGPKAGERKPRRADLVGVLTRGIDGTGMPTFAGLPLSDRDALASYVIHLSIRGEVEMKVLEQLLRYEGFEDETATVPNEVQRTLARRSKPKDSNSPVVGVAADWARSNRTPIVPTPYEFPTADHRLESAARGYKLFVERAQCGSCHINFGKGSLLRYDAWATIVQPRNLYSGNLRGGRRPEDIYARLWNGITPSGMPEHKQLQRTPEEVTRGVDLIWDLTNFVLHLNDNDLRLALKSKRPELMLD